MRIVATPCLLAVLATGCVTTTGPPTPSADTNVELERYRKSFALSGQGAVSVTNPHGDIRLRSAKGGEPLLAAVIQRIDGESRPLDFDVRSDGLVASITIAAPDNFNGRIDAVVMIPDGARSSAVTSFGLLEARLPYGDVDARTDSGKIHVRTNGRVRAESASGDIFFSVNGSGTWSGPTVLQTGDGNITITMPLVTDANLDVSGRAIDNQLPGDIDAELTQTERRVKGRVNAGTNTIRAQTATGTATIIGY